MFHARRMERTADITPAGSSQLDRPALKGNSTASRFRQIGTHHGREHPIPVQMHPRIAESPQVGQPQTHLHSPCGDAQGEDADAVDLLESAEPTFVRENVECFDRGDAPLRVELDHERVGISHDLRTRCERRAYWPTGNPPRDSG